MFKLTLNPDLSWRVEGKGPEVFIKVLGEKNLENRSSTLWWGMC